MNYGSAKLKLISWKFFINNKDIGGEKGVIDFIPEEFANSLVWKNYTGSYPNRAITPNSNLELLAWSPSNYSDSEKEKMETDKNQLRKILKDLTLKIEYQSYSDELELSWYGRNLKEETKPNNV